MLEQKLSLILPAHNEAENIEAVVNRALEVLPKVTAAFEIIVVNDGSRDETGEIVSRLATAHPEVRLVQHEVNQGYGAALTSGFRAATGRSVMFMDADRQFDIADINVLLPYVPYYDIVAGYRIQRRDPFYRKLFGKMFGLAVWVLFGLRMRDIDCAFKIFTSELLADIELTSPGALINTELLIRARQRGATIVQVGVHHYPRPAGESSGGSPKVVFRAIGETLRLWLRLRREEPPAQLHPEQGQVSRRNRPSVVAGAIAAVVGALVFWKARRRDE
jgi:glycosyltransferase involved in cell wall biosynthesis